MSEFIRPVLYGADHPVSLLAPGAPLDEPLPTVHLAGPVCEAGDTLAHDIGRWLPPDELRLTGTGALIGIGQAGAYGAAMASVYNGRLRAAEVVIDHGKLALSRHRETAEDVSSRDADAYDRVPAGVADRLREGMTMALYLSLSLLAVMVAFEDPDHPAGYTDLAHLVFLTAIGLMLAHLLAFRLSSRLVARGERTTENVSLFMSQVVGGVVVTLAATLPILLLGGPGGLLLSEVLLLGLITTVGYVSARSAGHGRLRSLAYVGGVVVLTVVVLWIKGLAHH